MIGNFIVADRRDIGDDIRVFRILYQENGLVSSQDSRPRYFFGGIFVVESFVHMRTDNRMSLRERRVHRTSGGIDRWQYSGGLPLFELAIGRNNSCWGEGSTKNELLAMCEDSDVVYPSLTALVLVPGEILRTREHSCTTRDWQNLRALDTRKHQRKPARREDWR